VSAILEVGDLKKHFPIKSGVLKRTTGHVYAVDGVWGATGGFWVSTDAGANWTKPAGFSATCATLTGLGYSNWGDGYSIDPDPTDFNHVLYSSHSCPAVVGESFDGGTTWTSQPGQPLGAFDILAATPEPASMLLLGAGLLCVLAGARKRFVR